MRPSISTTTPIPILAAHASRRRCGRRRMMSLQPRRAGASWDWIKKASSEEESGAGRSLHGQQWLLAVRQLHIDGAKQHRGAGVTAHEEDEFDKRGRFEQLSHAREH